MGRFKKKIMESESLLVYGASYTIGWYLADMTTWPITCGLTYLSFRGKLRPPSWLQKRIQPFILKYPALSNTIKSRPMLAASILTVTTPINRLFLPLHIWIMIKYGNDIMKNLEKNPQVRKLIHSEDKKENRTE